MLLLLTMNIPRKTIIGSDAKKIYITLYGSCKCQIILQNKTNYRAEDEITW